MKALVVVAHPDDETLFLGGYMLKNPEWEWTVVSVTYSLDSVRGQEFQNACLRLSATPIMFGHFDEFDKSLDQELIISSLRAIEGESFDIVFTHNHLGEYGHPHHICVHQAVKQVFKKPHFFGYNSFSDFDIKLNAWELEKKRRILRECYLSQGSKTFLKLFDIAIERIISPSYVESSIEASFFGKNDIWSYENSSYEITRLERIAKEIEGLGVKSILEVGAHEGSLTEKLVSFANVIAFERSEVALSRGKERVPLADWVLGDFEVQVRKVKMSGVEAILFSEVIYYFNNYKEVFKALEKRCRFVIVQNVSKIHKQVENFMLEEGWMVKLSATSNPFGLAIYETRGEI